MGDGVTETEGFLDYGCQVGELFQSGEGRWLMNIWYSCDKFLVELFSDIWVSGDVIGGTASDECPDISLAVLFKRRASGHDSRCARSRSY